MDLYRRTNHGKIQIWSIEIELDQLIISWGEVGGGMQSKTENVPHGLASRTLDEQLESRKSSRINKKKDQGYVEDVEEAKRDTRTNSMGLKMPMLATPFKNIKNANYDHAMVQFKYDGHRCLIHNDGIDTTAYSRAGKPIDTIHEIMSVLDGAIHEGCTLDGELYHHGTPLQTINSWIKRRQPNTSKLVYMVYDIMTEDDLQYRDRNEILRNLHNTFFDDVFVKMAPTNYCDTFIHTPEIVACRDRAIADGYEGIIIRLDGFPYHRSGGRSKGLIKVKRWEDSEFEVIDIHESEDGWAILECYLPDIDDTFRVSAPGSVPEKTDILYSKHKYIHRMVTVEYPNFTKKGKPFQPVAKCWRDE